MTQPDYVYVTYIKSTPQKVWDALTTAEFTKQYWGCENISDWKKGSIWESLVSHDGSRSKKITGTVLESSPPARLVFTWSEPSNPEDESVVAYDIEKLDDLVRLTVTHGKFKAGSLMPGRIANGWPRVLSSLKTFLETGTAIDVWTGVKGCCSTTQAA